eukprot:gene22940-35165_t
MTGMYTISFKYKGLDRSDEALLREAADVEERLRRKLAARYGCIDDMKTREKLKQTFELLDEDGSGAVSLQEFLKVMERHSFVDRDDVLTALFHKYDFDDSGALNYDEFCRGLYGEIPVPGNSPECVALCRRISHALSAGRGNRDLIVTLRKMDRDGNGHLDAAEITTGLAK